MSARLFCAIVTLVVLYIWIGCGEASSSTSPLAYTINLSDAPEERWREVAKAERSSILRTRQIFLDRYGLTNLPTIFIEGFLEMSSSLIPQPFRDELQGISKYANVSLGRLILLNVLYEMTAHCTSVLAVNTGGEIWHGRTFEFGVNDTSAKQLKSNVRLFGFYKNKQRLYQTVGFPGHIGAFTGARDGGFSLSLHQRSHGSKWNYVWNILLIVMQTMLRYDVPFVTFATRSALENSTSFASSTKFLTTTRLVAPAYFIVGGLNSTQGVVIARDRLTVDSYDELSINFDKWFMVQRMEDRNSPDYIKDAKRLSLVLNLRTIGRRALNNKTMFSAFQNAQRIGNGKTIYLALMCPKKNIFLTS